MPKRRGSGEGSVYQTKDGRWRAEISLGYKSDGKPRRKILYGSKQEDVVKELRKVLRDRDEGINIRPEKQSVSVFLDSWLNSVVKLKNRAQTIRSYSWIIESHLKPGLGKLTLNKLSPQQLQTFLAERFASGLSATTVKHIRATIRAALSHAERQGLVHRNAAKLVTIPRAVRFEPAVLAPDQASKLLKYLASHKHEALYVVALTMGLRRGELLGLQWSDIDFETGYVDVRQALHRVKGKGLHLADLKTTKAKRQLRIPQLSVAALARWRGQQATARQWAGSSWKESNFVFTSSIGTPLHPDDISRELPAILKAASLPAVRLHDLRHCCATLLLSMGVSAKMVQETLGHSSYQLTMDTYSHAIPALRNEVADKMDEAFGSTPTKAPTKTPSASVSEIVQ